MNQTHLQSLLQIIYELELKGGEKKKSKIQKVN